MHNFGKTSRSVAPSPESGDDDAQADGAKASYSQLDDTQADNAQDVDLFLMNDTSEGDLST